MFDVCYWGGIPWSYYQNQRGIFRVGGSRSESRGDCFWGGGVIGLDERVVFLFYEVACECLKLTASESPEVTIK